MVSDSDGADRATARSRAPLLVGRDRDRARVLELLNGGAPIITITGPVGAGKTTLARAVADQLRREGRSTAMIDVSEVTDDRGLIAAVANATGAPSSVEGALATARATVARVLATEALVLFVDNFEHLVSKSIPTLLAWLEAAPELSIVVGSRVRLKVVEEHAHELAPLGLPAPGEDPLDCDAVRLWMLRVRAANPTYAIAPAEVASVAELARRLDGLPLAIELAAARSTVLQPARLVERLATRFDVLSRGGTRDRHAALNAAIDVSWDLLDERQRRAFAMCSVFRGGFTLEAAEAVLDDGLSSSAAIDDVQSLRESSLLVSVTPNEAPGEPRFAMLLGVRAYAEERLAAQGEQAETVERHRVYYVALAERARCAGALDLAAHRRLELERENFDAVVERCADQLGHTGSATATVRLLWGLEDWLWASGRALSVSAALTRALDALGGEGSITVARGLTMRAELRVREGRIDEAAVDARRAVELAVLANDREQEAAALTVLSRAVPRSERDDLLNRALAAASGSPRIEADVRFAALELAQAQGRVDDARAHAEAAARIFRSLGAVIEEHNALRKLVQIYLDAGDPRARGLCEEGLATMTACGAVGKFFVTIFHFTLGLVELLEDRFERAASIFHERMLQAYGDPTNLAFAHAYWALALRFGGEHARARVELAVATDRLADLSMESFAALVIAVAASLEADEDHVVAAHELMARARAKLNVLEGMPAHRLGVDLAEAHLALADARAAAATGRLDDAGTARARAEALLHLVQTRVGDALAPVHRFREVRLIARGVERVLRGAVPWPATAAVVAVRVSTSARWFEARGAPRIDLKRRAVMRRVLHVLVSERAKGPGGAVTSARLLEAGWPGERMRTDAARNRLKVMIARLRELGLRDAIEARADGYALVGEIEVVNDDDA